jgi:hypothetical protein
MRHDGHRQAENPLITLSSFARPPLCKQVSAVFGFVVWVSCQLIGKHNEIVGNDQVVLSVIPVTFRH